MTDLGARRPLVGQRLVEGTLYRRIPNTLAQWNPSRGRPTKLAFRPDTDPATGEPDDSVSMYLASLTTVDDVKFGHDGYAVCEIDIARMIAVSIEKHEPIVVKYDPIEPAIHPADHAHCAVENLHGPMQKVLARNPDVLIVSALPGPMVDSPAPLEENDRAG